MYCEEIWSIDCYEHAGSFWSTQSSFLLARGVVLTFPLESTVTISFDAGAAFVEGFFPIVSMKKMRGSMNRTIKTAIMLGLSSESILTQ